jgi:serine/threonine protein kinase
MDWDEIAERRHWVQSYDWADTYVSQKSAIPGWVSSFRPGNPSSELVEELWGSFNWSCRMRFADGVEWLVRFARYGKVMDMDEKLVREVATMRLVREKTNIPVPKIHAWGLSNENTLRLGPFIIMDFVPGGVSLHDLWRESPDKAVLRSDISEGDLRTVYRQVAGFYLELFKLEFPHSGSLCFRDDQSIHPDLGPLTLKMQEIEATEGLKSGVLEILPASLQLMSIDLTKM